MTYVLIIIYTAIYAASVTTQPFTSAHTCEAARIAVLEDVEEGHYGDVTATCVQL